MAGKYKVILWDVDGTILNFEKAEEAAIRHGFERLSLGVCSDEMLADYSKINKSYWQKLERGEMTKPEILVGRFLEFFSKYGLDVSKAAEFNANYQVDLGDTVCFNDNARELIEKIPSEIAQFVVTNGTAVAQHKKLKIARLEELMEAFFISDEIGFEKPSSQFFDYVFNAIEKRCGNISKSEILIIGDSLTSDIKGGNNAGIDCCWYNPKGINNDSGLKIDYEIKDLNEILNFI